VEPRDDFVIKHCGCHDGILSILPCLKRLFWKNRQSCLLKNRYDFRGKREVGYEIYSAISVRASVAVSVLDVAAQYNASDNLQGHVRRIV